MGRGVQNWLSNKSMLSEESYWGSIMEPMTRGVGCYKAPKLPVSPTKSICLDSAQGLSPTQGPPSWPSLAWGSLLWAPSGYLYHTVQEKHHTTFNMLFDWWLLELLPTGLLTLSPPGIITQAPHARFLKRLLLDEEKSELRIKPEVIKKIDDQQAVTGHHTEPWGATWYQKLQTLCIKESYLESDFLSMNLYTASMERPEA